MSVWLWDASDPGDFGGVSGDDAVARQAAERYLHSGQAATARVELARLLMGGGWLTSGYRRSGVGWNGSPGDEGVTWSPFAPPLEPPSRSTATSSPNTNARGDKTMDHDLQKRLLAIDVLLEMPEDVSDVLESELYVLRDRLQAVALQG